VIVTAIGWVSVARTAHAIATVAAAPAPAAPAAPVATPLRTRTFGIGTVLGGGVSYNIVPSLEPPQVALGPQADFGTLELRWFFAHGGSIDVYSQLGNTLVSTIAAAVSTDPARPGQLMFASIGALYNANLLLATTQRPVYLLLASGLEIVGDVGAGGSFERTRPLKGALRIPFRVGVEWLVGERRSIGIQLMTRTFFEFIGYASNNGQSRIAPGVASLLELGLLFY
jgi:hypothetical protein